MVEGIKLLEPCISNKPRLLSNIMEKCPNMVFIIHGGRILYVNRKGSSITGYKKKFIYSKRFRFSELMSKQDISFIRKIWLRREKQHNFPARECILITKKGNFIPVLLTVKTFNCCRGKIIVGIVTDITKQKQIENKLKVYQSSLEKLVSLRTEKLNESEKKYRTLARNIPGMVYRADKNWETDIIFGSEAVCGYTQDEFMERKVNWLKLILPEDKKAAMEYAEKLIKKGGNVVNEYRIKTKNNRIRWVEDHKIAVYSEKKEFMGVDGVVFDITKRKEAEAKIEEQVRRLSELDELKSRFLLVTSHELKTPLTPAKLQIQMLLNEAFGKLNALQKKSFGIVLRNIDRLSKLIDDIMEIALMKTAGFKVKRKRIEVKSMMKHVVSDFRVLAEKKGLMFSSRVENNPVIYADEKAITQVISNILDNAVKFTDEGSIKVYVKKLRDKILVSVKDTGRGINKNALDYIFKEFFQEEKAYTREYGGTGLGLSICKTIIEVHGGKIWAESIKGKGSVFYFTIPFKSNSEEVKE